ncbi:hypothetical protein [Oceanithermus sp.]
MRTVFLHRARWFAALLNWHLILLREELERSPFRYMTLVFLLASVLVYAPFVAWGMRELLWLAREEGFRPADVSLLPLAYTTLLSWMLGAATADRKQWWVIATAPVPAAVLGLDRALGSFLITLVMAGPYAWGALQAAGFQAAALGWVVTLPLFLAIRIRWLRRGWYPLSLFVGALIGWAAALAVKSYLVQGVLPLNPDHLQAREFLRPILSHLQMPAVLETALRAPYAWHLAAWALLFWGLAAALGREHRREDAPALVQRLLARWEDAPAAYALLAGWERLDVGLMQATTAVAFALAAKAYGFLQASPALLVWWALAALWAPVWSRAPALPQGLAANTHDLRRAHGELLAGRLRALVYTLVPFLLPPGGWAAPLLMVLLWFLQRWAGVLARSRPEWLPGVLVLAVGSLIFWLGGGS